MAGNQSSSSSDKIKEKLEQLEKKLIEKNQLINELTESLKKTDIISENKSVKDIRINVSGIDIEWETNIGTCIFEKLPVIMMWVGTTLAGLMSGIQAMVGPERFNLALQSQGRNSVETDWRVISQFADFNDGFAAIANIAAVAGWGVCKLVSLDKERKECRIIVRNSWEGLYQKALGVCWGSGMIAGKMSGVCSRLFETSCWAEQKKYIAKGDEFDEFIVRPSERSIEKEIENLLATDKGTRADVAVALQTMRAEAMERKNAEECLRESEEKYRLLVENANSIILRWDAEGNITYLNPYGLTFFGYILEEVIGRNVVGTIVPNTESITSRDLTLLMKDIQKDPDKFKNNENENIKKDGKRVWVSWTNRAVTDKNGNIVEILSIGNDITEKKNLEIRLQRAEKMEAIGTLAGGVAHDLNNILSGIVSYPDLLLMQISKDSPLRKPIVTIQKSGEKAAAIVQDLLTLARRGVAITEIVNLNAIVLEYINSPEYEKLKLLHPGIEIVANLDKDLLNIKGSSSQLFVTVMNLISNAAESILNHGCITILTENIYIDTLLAGYDDVTEGDYALLKVSD
ncbi:MAG: PAS domain S-box protein, partial [Proteobacteria bacterium]|nr:PAS domain S-box protein [Pseudomonadota bacterium]